MKPKNFLKKQHSNQIQSIIKEKKIEFATMMFQQAINSFEKVQEAQPEKTWNASEIKQLLTGMQEIMVSMTEEKKQNPNNIIVPQ